MGCGRAPCEARDGAAIHGHATYRSGASERPGARKFTERSLRSAGSVGQCDRVLTRNVSGPARRAESSLRRPRIALAIVFVGMTACGGPGWAAVTEVRATSPDATQLLLVLDYCDASRNDVTIDDAVESPSEVRVRLDIPIPSGDRDDCQGVAYVMLSSAIGDRTVVDDRSGKHHEVEFGTFGAPPTTGPPPSSMSTGG